MVEALRTVEPGVGASALEALGRPSADLYQVVLPGLLNELSALGAPLVLVLDDYHLVTNATCHQTLGFFLDHLPAGVHVALSVRTDPLLPLARMRARGELAEIRVTDLQFTDEEATALLNGSMGLQLATEDVARLTERTEGWAAGLVLAGLSLRGREDASGFVASFHGDNRHVADYLGAEVLARQPEAVRRFLLRTLVLERLSGPLYDAVLEAQGRPRSWSSWSARTCSWYRSTTGAGGTATIPCSRSCCGWSLPAASLRCCRPCISGRRLGIGRPATWMRRSVTPARPGSSPRPPR
jgi:LuxR family maltose regulon positive regulatory protein